MTFRHRAGVSPYTSSFDLAETCVFAKQSLGTILCGRSLLPLTGHILPAPLIPKLRGHFAEFLNEGFLDRLGILYPPTCVGLGTGTLKLPRGFSRGHGFKDFRRNGLGIPSQRDGRAHTRPAYTVAPARPTAGIPLPTPSPHR